MEKLRIGLSVDIKRTDRRIHPAVISNINTFSRSVTVEWFENGETKAKEIEIENIMALNPHLIQQEGTPLPTKTMTRRAMSSPLNNKVITSIPKRQAARENPIHSTGSVDIAVTVTPKSTGTIRLEEFATIPTPVQQQDPPIGTKTGSRSNATKGIERRRTKPLKQVEQLEKNREERRLRHLEAKDEKKNFTKESGNPNWEFLKMIKEFQSTLDFRPISDSEAIGDHQITVCVRKRPLNRKEINSKEIDVVTIASKDRVIVHEPKLKVDLTKYLENQNFRFDFAFDENCDNEKVYNYTAKPLVQTIFEGGMATCFAYGQTGSGKTHTMGGEYQGKNQNCGNGIYALTAIDVFKRLQSPPYRKLDLIVSSSFFEIYSGKVFDLLNSKAKLRVLEDAKQQVQVVGLSERPVESVADVLELIRLGSRIRTSGQTSSNGNSSRSHAVFQIILRFRSSSRLHGKFSLVDLAGNERGADTTSADRKTRMEGSEINKSLLALKECIRALGRKGAHLPFRGSKLTQVLRDSFIGDNSKTCMIAMISPGMSSCEHSLNTLRYADRVKELATSDPVVQDPPSPAVSYPFLSEANLDSISEEDLSAELCSFQEADFRLQEMEEDVVDSHKLFLDKLPKWHQSFLTLMAMTDQTDVELEVYVRQMELTLNEMGEQVGKLKSKVSQFGNELQIEEQKNRHVIDIRNRQNIVKLVKS